MFAGATREVVFANPDVVRRIRENFVFVALKAGLVNNPPGGVEGRLYAEIGRTKPAPQGICVANSAGKALAWALSFDDDASITRFFEYAARRYKEYPDAARPVVTERFLRYPSHKLPDVGDAETAIVAPARHEAGERCPGRFAVEHGTLVGRVIGRALDGDGVPLRDTRRQEHYMEARFEIPPSVQRQLADAVRRAKGERFELPEALSRSLVGPAYLGQLDVDPLRGSPGSESGSRSWKLHGRLLQGTGGQRLRIRVGGRSNVAGRQRRSARRGDGRLWEHAVRLVWQGFIDLEGDRIVHLELLAEGHEKLRWGNSVLRSSGELDARHLMAGHPIDLDCGVRYGVVADPAPAAEVVGGAEGPAGGTRPGAVDPATARRIRRKLQRLQAEVKRRREARGDVSEVVRGMARIRRLLQQGKTAEAEAVLDGALDALGEGAGRRRRASPETGGRRSGEL